MSDTYTKLFSSITESTVWGEPYATRIVWVTLLAMANASGDCYASVPGLARRANVTVEEARAALKSFHAPDPDSRTLDAEGRRIADIDGGWHLINHAKYRAFRDEAERREYKKTWDRNNRPRKGNAQRSDKSRQIPTNPTAPTPASPASTSTSNKSFKSTSLKIVRLGKGKRPRKKTKEDTKQYLAGADGLKLAEGIREAASKEEIGKSA